MHCPECVKEARAGMPRQSSALLRGLRAESSTPVVTWTIIAICVVVWILQEISGGGVTDALVYVPVLTYNEPWRMITAVFAHSPGTIFHLALNMYSLYVLGPPLERLLGRARFSALYLLSGFGGSVAVLLIAPDLGVLGASGAIFGLAGAFFVLARKLGGNTTTLVVLIGINLVVGFVPGSGIAWEAHIGGLVVGAGLGVVFLSTRRIDQQARQVLLIVAIFAALVVLTLARLYAF